ncbi:PREDICTED: uncharacterized protein LOC105573738 [Cercocebus atys]|uniref:uncharacterized protein LOC105573738 n=1 Tax=Cercocebus atys TaxID=9531 RepID=UPI0005F46A2A|nr:PREDICTED: uncharacterized protein LOC105573738 [Cercocebus atys]
MPRIHSPSPPGLTTSQPATTPTTHPNCPLQELGKQRSTFRVTPGFSSAAHLATSALFIAVPADTRLRATHEWSGVWDKEAAPHWAASESHGDRAACCREEARSGPASATRAPAAPPSAPRPTRSGTQHRSRTPLLPVKAKTMAEPEAKEASTSAPSGIPEVSAKVGARVPAPGRAGRAFFLAVPGHLLRAGAGSREGSGHSHPALRT